MCPQLKTGCQKKTYGRFCSHMERGLDMLTVYYMWKGLSFLKKGFLLYVDCWFSHRISEVPARFVDVVEGGSRSPAKMWPPPQRPCALCILFTKKIDQYLPVSPFIS